MGLARCMLHNNCSCCTCKIGYISYTIAIEEADACMLYRIQLLLSYLTEY